MDVLKMYIKTVQFLGFCSLGEEYSLLYYKILLSVVQIIKGNCTVLQVVMLFLLLSPDQFWCYQTTAHPGNGVKVCSRNVRKPSHIDAAVCARKFHYIQQYQHTCYLKHTLLHAVIIRCRCYILELNHSINSKWAIFGLCHYCIQ